LNLDISYKLYSSTNDIHGTVLYPAPMIAPMQVDVLRSIIKGDEHITIMDPFNGSGVALYEAISNFDNIDIIGYDINPFANLITKVKLQGIDNNIDEDIEKLENIIRRKDTIVCEHYFNNINKWFRKDIIISLSIIKNAISQIENRKNRLYFWVIFSNVIRKYSNTRTSTYKLHIKEDIKISSLVNNSIKFFIAKIKKSYKYYQNNYENYFLKKCDSLKEMATMDDFSVDVIITSPPYGDNQTTVPYGQFSSLPLFWIDSTDLELDGWELDNYSIIDSNSMGGKKRTVSNERLDFIDKFTKKIGKPKMKKVYNFLDDYIDFMEQISRLTNKYIILTLGNRTVDGVNIDLTEFSIEYLSYKNFALVTKLNREIPKKRIPKKTSRVNNKSVKSMSTEFMVIFRRNESVESIMNN